MSPATARHITFSLILAIVAVMVVSCTTLPSEPPADAVKADIGFPSVGTKWETKTVNNKGRAWAITHTVLGEGTYKGTPVYRVSDGVNIRMFDKATRNWIAKVRAGTERSAASPYHPVYSFPLWVGKSWIAGYTYYDRDRGRTFFDVPWRAKVTAYEDVTVPVGTFKAFKLEGGDPGGRHDVWYSPELKVNVKTIGERFPSHYRGPGKWTTEVIEYSTKAKGSKGSISIGELAYHDGIEMGPISAWSSHSKMKAEVAVKFTPSQYPATLKGVKFYTYNNYSGAVKLFNVHGYEDCAGFPCSRKIFSSVNDQKAEVGRGWVTVDVPDTTIEAGSFWISMEWQTTPLRSKRGSNSHFLGYDAYADHTDRNYEARNGNWSNLKFCSGCVAAGVGDLMITAVMTKILKAIPAP